MRPYVQEVIERANLIDGDLLAGFLLAGRFRRFAILLGLMSGTLMAAVAINAAMQRRAGSTVGLLAERDSAAPAALPQGGGPSPGVDPHQ